MPLVLTLNRARDPSGQQRESRTLDDGTLSIGRGAGNGWVLPDAAQQLSKVHCIVGATRGGFVLTDCSSNGTFVNGSKQRMPRDSQVALADGDEFALGDYVIQVRTTAAVASQAGARAPAPAHDDPFGLDDFLAPSRPAAQAPPPTHDPFADPARAARLDPFGDDDGLLGAAPAPAPRPFNEPAVRPSHAPPDPFDRLAPHAPDPFGADDGMFRGAAPAVAWQGPSQPDDADAVHGSFLPGKPITPMTTIPADAWDDLLGDTPPGMPEAAPPRPQPPSPPQQPPAPPPSAPTPSTLPLQEAPPAVAVAPAPPPAAATAGVDGAALVAAFLDGAGVGGLDVAKQDPAEWLRGAGALFGLMVESLRDVLMSRAAVKGEFGIEQTMLRPRENNALKFSLTPADAIAALLQPGRPGYMDPLVATREAFDDVRAHQLAVMAGVQAALFNLLRTFEPAALEARLQKGGVMQSLIPATRRAKLWDAFVVAYKEIARDADSDFQDVFGREFTRAYTQQANTK